MSDASQAAHSGNPAPHPYHLVDPSPWPALGALAAFVLAFGAVHWWHGGTPLIMAAGFALVLTTMAVWWRDVVHEAQTEQVHTDVVRHGLRVGMVLFIASEVMFFVAFFWAYFNVAFFPDTPTQFERTEFLGGVWPPSGVQTFDPFDLPFLNTMILLLSGCTVTWAHHALRQGDRQGLLQGLGLTVILGLLFTSLQAYEYSHAAFGFREGIYSTTFYMLTGFHGFHVMVGTVFLAVCWLRAYWGHFKPNHHVGFEMAAWYWHFVDVVWLFLFVAIYWYGSAPAA